VYNRYDIRKAVNMTSSICDACTKTKKCRRYLSNLRYGTVVTNCVPPQFKGNGKIVEGLSCIFLPKKGQNYDNPYDK
jgi:hypothetical protein